MIGEGVTLTKNQLCILVFVVKLCSNEFLKANCYKSNIGISGYFMILFLQKCV